MNGTSVVPKMMSWRALILAAVGVTVAAVFLSPDLAFAQDSNIDNIGGNLEDLLRKFGEAFLYGVVAVVAIFFLIQRKYGELAVWVGVSLLVGWLVLSPDTAAQTGRDFVDSLLGG
jgi:uncharacterized metal-binding protein